MEIVKFGGSSLATTANIKLCCEIIKNNSEPQIIVVSAPGKFGPYQTKITDDLISYTQDHNNLTKILLRFTNIANELLPDSKYQRYLKILKKTYKSILKKRHDYNYIVSRGEYLTAKLVALYLDYKFIDAKNVLVINKDATIDLEATKTQITKRKLAKQLPLIIGGFYGRRHGRIALFTRGGSDYTGAILAALLHATIYKNYTDTNGIQTADPRYVTNPKTIPCLDFDALDILTHNGAGIIHENVASLLKQYRVPLRVDNTFNPHQTFTEVHSERCRNCRHDFFCITYAHQQLLLVTKKQNEPITIKRIASTPDTYVNTMQTIHQAMLNCYKTY